MPLEFEDVVICPAGEDEAGAVLDVYRQCEDFLALGPEPRASMRMVLDDLAHSAEQGGVFCGIYRGGRMVGVVDFVPSGFDGKDGAACLLLLMIAASHRGLGLGRKVVEAVEAEIVKDGGVREICSGVQANNSEGIGFWTRMGYDIVGGPRVMEDTTVCYDLLKTVG